MSSNSLLSYLRESLAHLSTPYPLQLTLIKSLPRKTHSLYPHTPTPPKHTIQDVLLLLSYNHSVHGNIIMSALETNIYQVGDKATVIYISKLDTTGHTPCPGVPFTKTLTVSFLKFYINQGTQHNKNTFIHLFARPAGVYLFPDSDKVDDETRKPKKKTLNGLGLSRWWKLTLEDTIKESGVTEGLSLNYVLCGYSEVDAKNLLGQFTPLPSPLPEWTYNMTSLPSPISKSTPIPDTLPYTVPSFIDDARTRFLVELSMGPTSSSSKIPPSGSGKKKDKMIDQKEEEDRRVKAVKEQEEKELSKVSAQEFWERLGFRQECAGGDSTSFFCVTVQPAVSLVPTAPSTTSTSPAPKLTEQESTLTLPKPKPTSSSLQVDSTTTISTTTSPSSSTALLSKPLFDRLHGTLLSQGFAPSPASIVPRSSALVLDTFRKAILEAAQTAGPTSSSSSTTATEAGDAHAAWMKECFAEIPATVDVGFVVEREKKRKEMEDAKEKEVTVLQVRKKKKVVPPVVLTDI